MLAIGRGLMAGPKLLVLDEPTLGLSPIMRKEVSTVTKKINQSGTSIILVEQDAQMALRISNRGIVLQNGRVVMQGPSQELLNNPELQRELPFLKKRECVTIDGFVKNRQNPNHVIPVPHQVRDRLQPESSILQLLKCSWTPGFAGVTIFYLFLTIKDLRARRTI